MAAVNAKIFIENETIGAYDLTFTDNYSSTGTASFKSREFREEYSNVRIQIDNKTVWGGFILDSNESEGLFSYDCVDYSRLLQSDFTEVYQNKRADQIAKDIISNKGEGYLKTGGIKKTKIKHPKLAWKNKKAFNIMHQLANLEDKTRFSVNVDGVCILEPIPSQEKGYVFTGKSVSDYDLKYDSSDIITGVKFYGKDDKLLYNYNDSKMTAKYGIIVEILEDTSITSKSVAKNKASALFKEKKNKVITGNITIPTVLTDLKAGQYCAFTPPAGSPSKAKTYFVNSVTTKVGEKTYQQEVTILDGKPKPPSEWIYEAPNEDKNSAECSKKKVTNPKKVYGSCGNCTYEPAKDKGTVSFEDYCPFCDKYSVLKFTGGVGTSKTDAPEGQWSCKKCDADFCAKCGYEKLSKPRKHLRKATGCSKPSGVESIVYNKAVELKTAYNVYKWIRANVKYRFYYDNKYGYTSADLINGKAANCYDQSQLVVDMLKSIGQKAERKCGRVCSGYKHCNVDAVIDGQKYRIDTACGKGVYKKI